MSGMQWCMMTSMAVQHGVSISAAPLRKKPMISFEHILTSARAFQQLATSTGFILLLLSKSVLGMPSSLADVKEADMMSAVATAASMMRRFLVKAMRGMKGFLYVWNILRWRLGVLLRGSCWRLFTVVISIVFMFGYDKSLI